MNIQWFENIQGLLNKMFVVNGFWYRMTKEHLPSVSAEANPSFGPT